MHKMTGGSLHQLVDYVMNNATAWTFPEIRAREARRPRTSPFDLATSTLRHSTQRS